MLLFLLLFGIFIIIFNFYILTYKKKKTKNNLTEDNEDQTEEFVDDLVDNLTSTEEAIADLLSEQQIDYLFQSVVPLIYFMFQKNNQNNNNGNDVFIRRCIFALQQSLPNYVIQKHTFFSKLFQESKK